MSGKVRKTLTLDPDVVEVLAKDGDSLSHTVNAILRAEVERRDMRAALGRFLDKLEAEHGPPDPEGVKYYRDLLSS